MIEVAEALAEPGRPRRWLPRGRLLPASALVLVLAGTGLGTRAADTWPWPEDRYEKPDAYCGIKGLTLDTKRRPHHAPMITDGSGPVRTCDRDITGSQPKQRLMTVEDPRLAGIFTGMALYEGERVRSDVGSGGLGPNLGVFRTRCQAGETVFVVQANESGASAEVRTLFPRYVEAEAARLGCGPLKLEPPRPGEGR